MRNDRPPVCVTWTSPGTAASARELARRLGRPLRPASATSRPVPAAGAGDEFVLVVGGARLELHADGGRLRAWSEMVSGPTAHRGRTAGRTRDLLVAAVGPPAVPGEWLLDATAGLGRDAFTLASLGYRVLACERDPTVAELLADGLQRARDDLPGNEAAERIELIREDACSWIARTSSSEAPAVIYIDPMHPARRKSALVRQELQVLQRLLGPDDDGPRLLQAARGRARRRVVVKRPPRAPTLADDPPRRSLSGRRARFDVYGPSA